jgi:hypothetical protein
MGNLRRMIDLTFHIKQQYGLDQLQYQNTFDYLKHQLSLEPKIHLLLCQKQGLIFFSLPPEGLEFFHGGYVGIFYVG